MNKFNRVILSVSGACLVIGVIILIGVSATGGWSYIRDGLNGEGWNWSWNWNDDSHNSNYEYEDFNVAFDNQEIKSIDAVISYGDVTIKQGDKFSLAVKNAIKDSFDTTQVEDGVLKIKQEFNNFIGFHFDFNDKFPKIEITVPANFTADDLKLDLDAGDTNLSNLKANKLDIHCDDGEIQIEDITTQNAAINLNSGDCSIKNLTAKEVAIYGEDSQVRIEDINTEYADLDLNSGDFNIKNLTANKVKINGGDGMIDMANVNLNDLSLDLNSGDTKIQGVVTGNCKISSGDGQVDFDLDGNKDDYYIKADLNDGGASLNDDNIGSSAGDKSAKNTLDIKANSGSVKIRID